jgi:hypothetical protein
MKYIKTYEIYAATDAEVLKSSRVLPHSGSKVDSGPGRIFVYDNSWKKLLPQELTVVSSVGPYGTDKGRWRLKLSELIMNHPMVQFDYHQHTPDEFGGDVLADGEPDFLCFDLFIVNDNNGGESQGNLKIDFEITYGEAVMSDFTIEMPNKISVISEYPHHSTKDTKDYYYFSSESLAHFVKFINRFGFTFKVDDFHFLDEKNINS